MNKEKAFRIAEEINNIIDGKYEMEIYECDENGLRSNSVKSLYRGCVKKGVGKDFIGINHNPNEVGDPIFEVYTFIDSDDDNEPNVNAITKAKFPFIVVKRVNLNGEDILVFISSDNKYYGLRGTSKEYPQNISTRNELADVIAYFPMDTWYEDVTDMIGRVMAYVPTLRYPVKNEEENKFEGEELTVEERNMIAEDSAMWESAKEFMFPNGDDYILFKYKGKKYCAKYMTDPNMPTELDGDFLSEVMFGVQNTNTNNLEKALKEYEESVDAYNKEVKEYNEYIKEHPEEAVGQSGHGGEDDA